MYHDKELGELYDLQADPWEHVDLGDCPNNQALKNQMIREAFDAHVTLTTDMDTENCSNVGGIRSQN